jgi:hypothetical protein
MADQTLGREDRTGSLKLIIRNLKDTGSLNRIVSPLCQLVADIKTSSMEELLRRVLKEDTPITDTLEKKPNTGRHRHSLSEVPEVECEPECHSAVCSVGLTDATLL